MSSLDNTKFIADAVAAMNAYRKLHQVESLTHNPELTRIAQGWVDHLATTGKLSHNPNAKYQGQDLGENCAMKWSSELKDYTGVQCVDQWYSEIERYDFQKHSGPSTGHFTQVVWKGSREVGIGRVQTKDGKWFACADFYPAGNYVGRNAENVFPTRDGKFVLPQKEDLKPQAPSGSQGGTEDQKSTTSKGESVKREIRTETTGSGANAVTKTIITETRTAPDGTTKVTTTEKITKGEPKDLEGQLQNLDVTEQQSPAKFIEEVIKHHNFHRAKHQVGSLTENKELTALAQKWAEHLSAADALKHSNDKYRDQPVGENVAAKSGTGRVDYTGQAVVDQWYSESSKFDYSKPEGTPGVTTGHFSQVVWKGSQEIGVGKAISSDGHKAIVVCNYFPAGNYKGRHAENVLPPK